MKIIILGATGYLGSRIVKELVKKGHHVLCLIRKTSNLKNILEIKDYIEICSVEELPLKLASCKGTYDLYFNAACRYSRGNANDIDVFESNLYVPLKVFLTCMNYRVQRYITIGTGLPDNFNVYTYSKHQYANIGKWYCEHDRILNCEFQFLNIRLENYYGPEEPIERFLPSTIQKLKRNEKIMLTEGLQKRDFIYIGDVVRIILDLLEEYHSLGYWDIPLGTGEGIQIKELVEYLKRILNSDSELCFGAIPKRLNEPDSVADCTLLNKLGLYTQYDLESGLKLII